MNNLAIKISDEDKLLDGEDFKDYNKRLRKYEGNFLEIGNYLLPFFGVPFLKNAEGKIETSDNIVSSAKGYVAINYDSTDYSGIRYVNKKCLIMKIDKVEDNFVKARNKLESSLKKLDKKIKPKH